MLNENKTVMIDGYEVSKDTLQEWCDVLRSGKYKQTKGKLQWETRFCCLGLGCHIFIPQDKKELKEVGTLKGSYPSDQLYAPGWLKRINEDFCYKTGCNLSLLNDFGDEINTINPSPFTFDEIADVIEAVYIHEVLN